MAVDLAKAKHRTCVEMLFVLVPLGAVVTALTTGGPSNWSTFSPLIMTLLMLLVGGLYTLGPSLPRGMRAVLQRLATTEATINLLVVLLSVSSTAARYTVRMGCPPLGPLADCVSYALAGRQFLVRPALADIVTLATLCANLPLVWASRHRPFDGAAAIAGQVVPLVPYFLLVRARIRAHLRRADLERRLLPPELELEGEEGAATAPPQLPVEPLQPLEVVRGGLRQATDSLQEIDRIVRCYREDRRLVQQHGHGLLLLCLALRRLDIQLPRPAALRIASFLGSLREADPPVSFGPVRWAAAPSSSDGESPSDLEVNPALHRFRALFGWLSLS